MAFGYFFLVEASSSLVEEDGRDLEDARFAAGRGPTRQVKIHLGEEEWHGQGMRRHGNAVAKAFSV